MNFDLTDEQRLVQKSARDYAERALVPRAAARDREGTFPKAELAELGRLGFLGMNVPAELGGAEAGPVAYALAMIEIAGADASVAVTMAVTNLAAEIVSVWGNEGQRRAHLPRLVGGEPVAGAFALSEPQSGSDAASLATVARRVPGGWRLTGTKQWVTNGAHAGVFVLFARTNAQAGPRGVSAFLVTKDAPGLSVGRAEDKLGIRGSLTVQLHLEECEVADDDLLGEEGQGMKLALSALDGGRIGIAAQAVGIATAALAAATGYARERVQFGVPIARHQAVQLMLADMATRLEAARLLVLRAAFLKERRRRSTREASIAKLFASEAAWAICDAALQIHGGYGYTREFPVERYLRDARVTRIYEGTSEIQRIVIARELVSMQGEA